MGSAPERQAGDDAFFALLEQHRARLFIRVMHALPRDPRCSVCRAPFAGIGGSIMRHFGYRPSRKNARLCESCFARIPDGGAEMSIGVLFADVRGFTALAEHQGAAETTALLNRFYEVGIAILSRHAIIDKLVGDQVMALYLPHLLDDRAPMRMVQDARELIQATPNDVQIGVGIDFGPAVVGNVGSGSVKDFTAIGDVVNTASRLQGAAAAGEIVLTLRVADLVADELDGAERRTLELKGKSAPEPVLVLHPHTDPVAVEPAAH
jgi:adenylate cyclase